MVINNAKVTLETKCWQGDWGRVLKSDWLLRLRRFNCHPFAECVLMINNVDNYAKVSQAAQRAVDKGYISKYYVVKDYADEALDHFGITAESLGRGYVYSIAELVSIYLCQTSYLLHFSSDSIPSSPCNWVDSAIELMEQNSSIKVANLSWSTDASELKPHTLFETADFFVGYGFSDQCYLVRTAEFRQRIYNESHPMSERYPKYGGELFEKRVDSWMRVNNFLRATAKAGAYGHLQPSPNVFTRFKDRVRRHLLKRHLLKWSE